MPIAEVAVQTWARHIYSLKCPFVLLNRQRLCFRKFPPVAEDWDFARNPKASRTRMEVVDSVLLELVANNPMGAMNDKVG